MSGIARVFAERGHTVTGSDRSFSEVTDSLRSAGVEVFLGHEASHLGDCDTVVFSSAVREENPEYGEALRRGLTGDSSVRSPSLAPSRPVTAGCCWFSRQNHHHGNAGHRTGASRR
jgi:UDP-N-acetylmuramoylalanine-D-glutamate ligase